MKYTLLSQAIAENMEKGRVSQGILSLTLGVPKSTIGRWCTGQEAPKIGILPKLASQLNVEVSDLLSCLLHDEGYGPEAYDDIRMTVLLQDKECILIESRLKLLQEVQDEFRGSPFRLLLALKVLCGN